MLGSTRRASAELVTVLLVAWLARGLFILIMPATAHAVDVDCWIGTAQVLEKGANPYATTTYLKYPPLLMQVVWVIYRISAASHVPFLRVLQIVLIVIESGVIVVLFRLLKRLAPQTDTRRVLLVAISLNPVAILQVCQHGNFDVLVGLWVLLAVGTLVAFQQHHEPADWLWGCMLLGLAALTKQVGLIMVPLLAAGARLLPARTRLLGALLAFGPVALGVSAIYVLARHGVLYNVLAFRSVGGYFGISGLLALVGAEKAARAYGLLFDLLVLVLLLKLCRVFWHRQKVSTAQIIMTAALLLAGVPALGAGYAPQYIYWFLPLLVLTAGCYGQLWVRLLLGCWFVAAVTYTIEYALVPSHGRFLVELLPDDPRLALWSDDMSQPAPQTILRLPLFACYLTLLTAGILLLRQDGGDSADAQTAAAGSARAAGP